MPLLLLDANVLLLWTVGAIGVDRIARVRRTDVFTEALR
jgi:hypothetical protein